MPPKDRTKSNPTQPDQIDPTLVTGDVQALGLPPPPQQPASPPSVETVGAGIRDGAGSAVGAGAAVGGAIASGAADLANNTGAAVDAGFSAAGGVVEEIDDHVAEAGRTSEEESRKLFGGGLRAAGDVGITLPTLENFQPGDIVSRPGSLPGPVPVPLPGPLPGASGDPLAALVTISQGLGNMANSLAATARLAGRMEGMVGNLEQTLAETPPTMRELRQTLQATNSLLAQVNQLTSRGLSERNTPRNIALAVGGIVLVCGLLGLLLVFMGTFSITLLAALRLMFGG